MIDKITEIVPAITMLEIGSEHEETNYNNHLKKYLLYFNHNCFCEFGKVFLIANNDVPIL